MKWACLVPLIAVLFFLASCIGGTPSLEQTLKDQGKLTLSIVYDNNDYDQRLETRWGFSCMIEGLAKTILFDTGGDGVTLLGNMRKLGIDPAEVEVVVLSHIHGDHIGGLNSLLEENSDVIVYLPESFPQSFKDGVESLGARVHEVSKPEELFAGIYTTGELDNGIREQSLVITTSKGLVVITGCAHPGVVDIIQTAKGLVPQKEVYLTMGGFHMSGASTRQIQSVIEGFRQLGVIKVAPCHCSGDETRRLFKEEYREDYINSGAGKIIAIP
jgi:7,8-dihydropterin-6-yl-methyl-4-(beta-D-ribofuranosyl)aminobenzene 5'-phosphate synthase